MAPATKAMLTNDRPPLQDNKSITRRHNGSGRTGVMVQCSGLSHQSPPWRYKSYRSSRHSWPELLSNYNHGFDIIPQPDPHNHLKIIDFPKNNLF